ncbi:PTS sugar transporter subunit IIC [Aggregicoccus sp. 17bor-14]|uniref:PTS sugar transporter subunit IIC n=1 Tax=Myxococcaceae TaxID=31 RepID=UPI00129D0E7C|nr:PTS sugar transporter subunit IIC [Simulacricoccus sp. 17bor-14]MRI87147.1 PTS sugar transporter subunit IIC [Aggregicoccus sp. 17bor-14]
MHPLPATSPGESPGLRARLQAVADFFTRQRHLVAVRDGVVGALPLVLVGSLFLLAAQPPFALLQAWVAPYVPLLLVPYRMLGGLIAVYVTFCCAHSLAKSYALDPMAAGLVAMAAYLVAAYPTPLPGPPLPPALPLARLGAGGIFAGLLLALSSVELTRLFVRRNWTLRLPGGAPEAVVRSFVALLPCLATILLTFLLVHVAGVDLVHLLERAAQPFLVAAGSLPATLAVVAVDSTLWLLGVHASAALATLRPLWESMLVENMAASAAGLKLPHLAPLPFYSWFVWQGGSGAALPLALLLVRAKSAQLRAVGRVGLLPALCNVNEPLLFGVPVVLNATLAVPFILVPLLSSAVAYGALAAGWVSPPFLEMPWTLPAPLGAFLSTKDPRAVLLQMFNLALGLAVYWPFVRRYDRRLLAKEAEQAGAARLSSGPQSP